MRQDAAGLGWGGNVCSNDGTTSQNKGKMQQCLGWHGNVADRHVAQQSRHVAGRNRESDAIAEARNSTRRASLPVPSMAGFASLTSCLMTVEPQEQARRRNKPRERRESRGSQQHAQG